MVVDKLVYIIIGKIIIKMLLIVINLVTVVMEVDKLVYIIGKKIV